MIIDSHIHLGYTPEFWFYDASIERLIAVMDRLGIAYAVNAHSECLIQREYDKGYRGCADAYEKSGGRILSYYLYDPREPELCLEKMRRYGDRRVFRGVKIHPTMHHTYADDPSYDAAWQFARDEGLPVMSHTWEISSYNPNQKFSTPERFVPYIERYPTVKFICGHAGGRGGSIRAAADMAARYGNVYLDIAGDVYEQGLIDFLAGACGAAKVLFGSDMLWFDPATQLGMVLSSGLTGEETDCVLWKNAAGIFGIEGCGGGAA